ncbi:hypothetical protein BEWA_027490 [Theileria equi strain WA]|uniref:Uncharacterized protein n=1 Tax=Theileria equi strain WA TaxID=1537102 RepID=L0AWI9_THEEQ|nr:hypothetical protein BEWA_027490 [Theileria equi strain WA]AFZ79900.1 hypothetical protein BEWA_027490 [Theileria equi strain WA]|eukprot:XP_004829566.1 hypothetical protein BEWA_027490 [Theileria equi strain WA]
MAEDPPPVTIYLSKNKEIPPEYRDDGSGKLIKVTRDEEPPISNFTRYTHKDKDSDGISPFTLKEIWNDQNKPIAEINGTSNVTSVEAYYWKHNKTKVLIVGITTTDRGTTYYGNRKSADGNNEWTRLHGGSQPNLINNDLERTLDDLVCSNYDAVTLDLSKGTSMGDQKPYCCRCTYHGPKGAQRTVSLFSGNIKVNGRKIEYYKHTVKTGYRVAKIRYYDKGEGTIDTNNPDNRRRIKSPELAFPTSEIRSVSAFYCGGNPELIYFEGNGSNGTNKWYKKPPGNTNGDEDWTEVLLDLKSITPGELSRNTECETYNKIANELSCASTVTCPTTSTVTVDYEPTQPSSQQEAFAGERKQKSKTEGVRREKQKQSESSPRSSNVADPRTDELNGIGDDKPKETLRGGSDPNTWLQVTAASQTYRGPEDGDSGGNGHPAPAGPGDSASGGKANGVSETPPVPPAQGGQSEPTTTTTHTEPSHPTPRSASAPDGTHAKVTDPVSGAILAGAGYFFATSAGSGAAGFLGYKSYKFYQSFKGDPWVIYGYPMDIMRILMDYLVDAKNAPL